MWRLPSSFLGREMDMYLLLGNFVLHFNLLKQGIFDQTSVPLPQPPRSARKMSFATSLNPRHKLVRLISKRVLPESTESPGSRSIKDGPSRDSPSSLLFLLPFRTCEPF